MDDVLLLCCSVGVVRSTDPLAPPPPPPSLLLLLLLHLLLLCEYFKEEEERRRKEKKKRGRSILKRAVLYQGERECVCVQERARRYRDALLLLLLRSMRDETHCAPEAINSSTTHTQTHDLFSSLSYPQTE